MTLTVCALVIGYSLYRAYRSQSDEYFSQLERMTSEIRDSVNERYQAKEESQKGGNDPQLLTDYIMASLIRRANEHPTERDLNRALNPLVPPIRRNSYYVEPVSAGLPVNIPTRGEMGPFSQMGYMYQKGNPKMMVPLYGRRKYGTKFEYYSAHHNNPSVKIPVEVRGDEELSDGDFVSLPGYGGKFKVKLYPIDVPRYL